MLNKKCLLVKKIINTLFYFRRNCIINDTILFENPHTNYILYLYEYQIFPAEFGPHSAKTWSIYTPTEFNRILLSKLIYKQFVWNSLCTFNDYLLSNRYFISSVSWKTFVNRCSPAGCALNKTLSISEALGALVDFIIYCRSRKISTHTVIHAVFFLISNFQIQSVNKIENSL